MLKEGHNLQDGPFWVYTQYRYIKPEFEVTTFCGEGRDGGPEETIDRYTEQELLDHLVAIESKNIKQFVQEHSR